MSEKKGWEIREGINDESITLSVLEGNRLALCELSKMFDPQAFGLPEGTWLYFSRLNVPASIRGRGIGGAMMQRLVEILDERQWHVVNEVNLYPDSEMTLDELMDFYRKYGFSQEGELFVRHPCDDLKQDSSRAGL